MLDFVKIQNYRLFDEFMIDDLARVNLLVGKNNVGKTSLLEAIYLLVNQKYPPVIYQLLGQRGEIAANINGEDTISGHDVAHLFGKHILDKDISFIIESSQLKFELSCVHKAVIAPKSILGLDSIKNNTNEIYHLHFIYNNIGPILERIENNNPFGDLITLGRGVPEDIESFNYIPIMQLSVTTLYQHWINIALKPEQDQLLEILRLLDEKIIDIDFIAQRNEKPKILVRHEQHKMPIPLGSMGEGMHRALTLGLMLVNSANGYLLIDEIDTGLHYRVITDIWQVIFKVAKQYNIQVFATTHSQDCVRSFAEALYLSEERELGALFRLQRRRGKIHAQKYNADRLVFAVSQDIEIR
ncbi:MAG: AAA family ATPase [Chloroflexota bacterium]